MNDERLERELRAALLQDDPGPVRNDLRVRVGAVPDEAPLRRGLVRSPRVSRLLASAATVAAVVVIGATIVIAVGSRDTTVGPAPSDRSSAVPTSPAPSTSLGVTPAPSATSVPSPVTGAWHGLRWSAPIAFPDAGFVEDVVAWNGAVIAAGEVQDNPGTGSVAFWRSSDGAIWTRIGVDVTPFAGAQFRHLLTTPSGLVGWGSVGMPSCTGQSDLMKCGPFPIMLWTSPDGVNWARISDTSTFTGATIDAVTVGSTGLVAVGDTGLGKPAIWVSATGSTWQRLSLSPATFKDAFFSDVRTTASGYVLAGGVGGQSTGAGGVYVPDPTATAAAWWSSDGRTWTKATVHRADGVGTSLESVYVGAHGLVAIGSATGGPSSAAWTSADGRTWQPIAPGYAGAPAVSPGVQTLPSFTIIDDGTRLIAVGVVDPLALRMWIASDGVTWQPLPFSGAVDTIPRWPGAEPAPTYYRIFVVPGGLVVTGTTQASAQMPVWRVTALP